jgi:hypothetical protein
MGLIRVMIFGLTILVLPARSDAADEWSFRLIPYVWMSGLSGDVATIPGAPEADIDMSFGDILENLDFAAFVVGEARRGDLFLRGEVSYAKISNGAATPGPLFSGADVTAETFFGGLAAGYTINRGAAHQVDAFAGFRYWVIDTELDLSAGVLPGQSVSETESFVDPLVGLSASYMISPDWSIAASGTIGGFGVGADLEWGFTTGITYHAGENWGVIAGYRYLAVDYDHGDFVYDVAQHGPFLGAVFDF